MNIDAATVVSHYEAEVAQGTGLHVKMTIIHLDCLPASLKNPSLTFDSLGSCGNFITAGAIPASSTQTLLTILDTDDWEMETVSAITDWKLAETENAWVGWNWTVASSQRS